MRKKNTAGVEAEASAEVAASGAGVEAVVAEEIEEGRDIMREDLMRGDLMREDLLGVCKRDSHQ